jgi:hypothetical protein
MKMFLLGFLACYVITSLLIYNDDDKWLDRFITPFRAVAIVVLIIPSFTWRFVRLCFKPVRPDVMNYLKGAYIKHLFGNIYFCHDKKAKNWLNKIFLFRYKN